MWWFAALVPAFFLYLLLQRVVTQWLDRRRIVDSLSADGSRLEDLDLALFGPGWFGAQGGRTYTVRFRDRDGREHLRSCRTSLFAGVYFTDELEGPVRLNLTGRHRP